MAIVTRFYSEFKDRKGKDWRVEFCDNEYTGVATEIKLSSEAFELNWAGNANEPHQPIVTSSAQFYLVIETAAAYNWLLEMPNAAPDRFTVAIKWGSTWQYMRWAGVLMVDGIVIEDIYLPQQVTLQANDDLARLQDVLYKATPTAAYTGQAYIEEHIRNCLLKLRTIEHWGASDAFLKVVPYLRPAQDTGNGISNVIIDHSHLYNTNDEGVSQYLSVWRVLEEIAYTYSARIFLDQGHFWLQPITAVLRDINNEQLLDVTTYSKVGIVSAALDTDNYNSFSTDIERIRGWNTSFLPRIKKVQRDYNSGEALILGYTPSIPQFTVPQVTGPQLVEGVITWHYLLSPLSGYTVVQANFVPRLTFTFLTSSDAVSGLTGNDRAVRWRIDLQIKLVGSTTYYLNRTTTHDTVNTTPCLIANGNLAEVSGVEYSAATWSTTDTSNATIITSPVAGTESYAISELIEVNLPQVIQTGVAHIKVSAHAIDAAGVEIDTPHAEVLYQYVAGIQLFPAQGEQLTADSYSYFAEQDEGREVIQLPTAILGDAVGTNTLNYLEFGTIGGTTVSTNVWEQIDETAQEPIHQLVVREILSYRAKALEIRSGTLRCLSISNDPAGILPFGYTLTESTNIYVCLSMTWRAAAAQYDVDICNLNRDITVITEDGGDIAVLGIAAVKGEQVEITKLPQTKDFRSNSTNTSNIKAALQQAMRSSERTNLGYVRTDNDGITELTVSSGTGDTRLVTVGGINNVNIQAIHTNLKRLLTDFEDYDGGIKAHAPIGKLTTPTLDLYKINPDSLTESTEKVSIQAPSNLVSSHVITLPKAAPATGAAVLIFNSSGTLGGLADGSSGEVLTTNGAGVLSWAAASGGGGSSDGWHGSTTLLKVMPSEFMANDDAPSRNGYKGLYIEDDTINYLGVRIHHTSTEMYVQKAIPTGYKATHVHVYASSSTSSAVIVHSFNHTTGAISSKGSGDFNSSIDITDITSAATSNINIKLLPASTSTTIYGADITLIAV